MTMALPTPPRSAKRRASTVLPRMAKRARTTNSVVKMAKSLAKTNPYVRAGLTATNIATKFIRMARGKKRRVPQIKGRDYVYGGRIKKGSKKMTAMDRYSQLGFVESQSAGTVMQTTRAVGYLAQSTMPIRVAIRTVIKALVKKLLQGAGLRIKNDTEPILDGQYYNSTIEIRYKVKDGEPVLAKNFVIDPTSTLFSVTNDTTNGIAYWLIYTCAGTTDLPFQLLTMRYYAEFGTLTTARLIQSELDLSNVTVHLYAESLLKLQNRTVNSTGKTEADEVDNVPLDGKFFDYKSNGTLYRDYSQPATAAPSNVCTDPEYGLLPTTLGSDTGTRMYQDIPLPSQFVGIQKHGDWVIQPGNIKESKITSKASMLLSKFINVALARSNAVGSNKTMQQFWLGKSRMFAFEKKILAAAADSVSQITVAYDHELRLGAYVTERKSYHTAPGSRNYPGVVI